MATKNNRETMIQFINENKGVYAGQADLGKINEMPDEAVQKLYRAVKTKVWSKSRRKPATMLDRIEATQNYDECVALKVEAESYLLLIDKRMEDLKAAKIESLKADISGKTAELKELEGQKKK